MSLLNLSIYQFLWVFIAANLLLKLESSRLLLRWLAYGGLTCYKIPTNDELRPLKYRAGSGDAKKKNSTNKTRVSDPTSDHNKTSDGMLAGPNEFKIRSSDLTKLTLNKVNIDWEVLLIAPYGEELELVADLACLALITFIPTQVVFYFSASTHEYNFSLIWILLILGRCFLILSRLTLMYFKNQVSIGERSICIVSGCIFLSVAMIVLALDGTRLELMVNESLESLWSGSHTKASRLPNKDALLDPDEIDTPPPLLLAPGQRPRPATIILVKLMIAVICSLVGVIFTFPGLRYGQLHENLLANASTNKLRIIYNLNFILPAIVICLWIPAISRNVLTKLDRFPFNDETHFEIFRISAYMVIDLLRLVVVRHYLQTFLLTGANRLNKIRYRGGTTTDKEVQLAIASTNNYANVACMQYILPALVCLFTSIIYATLYYYNKDQNIEEIERDQTKQLSSLRSLFGSDQQALVESVEEFVHKIRRSVSSDFAKNMFGFAAWWFHFAWCCTSTVGVVYHKFFCR